MYLERTLKQAVSIEGIGLHSGRPSRLTFRPAPAGSGVHFVRRDLPGVPSLPVQAHRVQATSLATTLGGPEFSVSTVEHCLSSLAAFRIDNLFIELEGPEIPICDGSAVVFSKKILEAGFVDQDRPRRYIQITKPIYEGTEEKHAYALPYSGLRISCVIDFPHAAIGHQELDVDINEQAFSRDISSARTFGFLKDVEAMRSRGLALGGSLENAVVLDENGVMNPEGLRFKDEFVRHKVLDALGDLVTLGSPLLGHVVLYRAGHDLMNKLVRRILESPGHFQFRELGGVNPELPIDPNRASS